jgi:diaminopimelate epimerase
MNRWPPRPTLSSGFYKAHGLGNDYLVVEEGSDWTATPDNVRLVCDRTRGVGADGIVVLLEGGGRSPGQVRLRMFNPDGGEFERSGNGLRILGSYLAGLDSKLESVEVAVGGDVVHMTLHGQEGPVHDVSVEMGRAATGPEAVGLDPEALTEGGSFRGPGDELLRVVPVSVGNPHMVILSDLDDPDFSEARMATVGPFVAKHSSLRNGANVQLARALHDGRCEALIWERGVGRTSASGTSACAVAVALVTSGLMAPGEITVQMPGGRLVVGVTQELDVVLRGPVQEICEGRLRPRLVHSMSS